MKIVFMGTPEFALTALKKLAAEHEIVAVYTRAPKPAGRGNKLIKSPVHLWAEEQGLEVRTPKTLRQEEEQQTVMALGALEVHAFREVVREGVVVERLVRVELHFSRTIRNSINLNCQNLPKFELNLDLVAGQGPHFLDDVRFTSRMSSL